jgi:hypothetical protein
LNDPGGTVITNVDGRSGASTASGFTTVTAFQLHLPGTGGIKLDCSEISGSVSVPVDGMLELTRVGTLHT